MEVRVPPNNKHGLMWTVRGFNSIWICEFTQVPREKYSSYRNTCRYWFFPIVCYMFYYCMYFKHDLSFYKFAIIFWIRRMITVVRKKSTTTNISIWRDTWSHMSPYVGPMWGFDSGLFSIWNRSHNSSQFSISLHCGYRETPSVCIKNLRFRFRAQVLSCNSLVSKYVKMFRVS
jgi:hypothetical protein